MLFVATFTATAQTAQDVAALKAKAERGDANAQCSLGAIYEAGAGVPKDYAQAATWFRKCADQGSGVAQAVLGYLYEKGLGVTQNDSQAMQWYRKAAEQGDAPAQLNLGALYARGTGLPQDYAEAYFWLDLAAVGKLDAANTESAAQNRDRAASYLTPADLSRAQERARKWFDDHAAKMPTQ